MLIYRTLNFCTQDNMKHYSDADVKSHERRGIIVRILQSCDLEIKVMVLEIGLWKSCFRSRDLCQKSWSFSRNLLLRPWLSRGLEAIVSMALNFQEQDLAILIKIVFICSFFACRFSYKKVNSCFMNLLCIYQLLQWIPLLGIFVVDCCFRDLPVRSWSRSRDLCIVLDMASRPLVKVLALISRYF